MPGFKELNDLVSLADQMQSDEEGPVVLLNVFTIDRADEEALVAAWKHDADFMKAQPGYISTQMHKGIAGSARDGCWAAGPPTMPGHRQRL